MADRSETPVLDLLARMTADSMEASGLDPKTLMLVRIAALVAVDAPPASYIMNLGAADEADIDDAQVLAIVAAVAPMWARRTSPRPGQYRPCPWPRDGARGGVRDRVVATTGWLVGTNQDLV